MAQGEAMVLRLLRLPYVVALVALHLSSALLAAPLQLYLLILQVRPSQPHTQHQCHYYFLLYSPTFSFCSFPVWQTTMGPQVLARSRVLHALLWLPRYRLAAGPLPLGATSDRCGGGDGGDGGCVCVCVCGQMGRLHALPGVRRGADGRCSLRDARRHRTRGQAHRHHLHRVAGHLYALALALLPQKQLDHRSSIIDRVLTSLFSILPAALQRCSSPKSKASSSRP